MHGTRSQRKAPTKSSSRFSMLGSFVDDDEEGEVPLERKLSQAQVLSHQTVVLPEALQTLLDSMSYRERENWISKLGKKVVNAGTVLPEEVHSALWNRKQSKMRSA
eukprot:gene9468-32455_t